MKILIVLIYCFFKAKLILATEERNAILPIQTHDLKLSYEANIYVDTNLDSQRQDRLPGIGLLSIDLELRQGSRSQLNLNLRPDFQFYGDPDVSGFKGFRERDGRVGEVVDQKPTLELLDHYQLGYHFSPSLVAEIGVKNRLGVNDSLYLTSHEFGLSPMFPAKTFFAGLKYRDIRFEAPQALPKPYQLYSIEFFAFKGRDARNKHKYNEAESTRSAYSQDPFWGLGIVVNSTHSPNYSYGLSAGSLDQKVITEIPSEALILHEEFLQTYLKLRLSSVQTMTSAKVLESRKPGVGSSKLNQIALTQTTTFSISPQDDLLLGLYWGQGDLDSDVELTGHMWDVGYRKKMALEGLTWTLLFSQEKRTHFSSNGRKGAFSSARNTGFSTVSNLSLVFSLSHF